MKQYFFKYLTISLVLCVQTANACDCNLATLQNTYIQESYESAEIIFLGIVQSVDEEKTTFSVIEFLKGDYKKDAITTYNKSSCSLHLEKDEMWLVYIEEPEDRGKYTTHQCLPNRNYGKINSSMKTPNPEGDNIYAPYERHQEVLKAIELNSLRQKKVLNEVNNLRKGFLIIKYGLLLLVILLVYRLFVKSK